MKAYLLLALVLTQLACRQPKAIADCDCLSTTYSLLTEKVGVYDRGYISTINTQTGQLDGSYLLSCNPEFIAGKAIDKDTIVLTGRVRPNCYNGETVIALASSLELTSVRKK
jgi:hypothetical protein